MELFCVQCEGFVLLCCAFFFRWTSPLSDLKHSEEAKNRREDSDSDRGMRDAVGRVNDERRTSRHLRTTVSAHHVVFPSFPPSVCLTPSCFVTISAILTYVFLYRLLLLFLTPPSPPLRMCLSPLSVYSLLCFYSCLCSAALVLSPLSCLFSHLDLSFNSVHVYLMSFFFLSKNNVSFT